LRGRRGAARSAAAAGRPPPPAQPAPPLPAGGRAVVVAKVASRRKALPGLTSANGRPGGRSFALVNNQSALRLSAAHVSRRQRQSTPLRPAGRAGRCLCPQLRVLSAAMTSCSAAESCACTRTITHALLLQRALLPSRKHMLVHSGTQRRSPYRGSTPYAQAAVCTELWRHMRLHHARLHACCVSDGGDLSLPSKSYSMKAWFQRRSVPASSGNPLGSKPASSSELAGVTCSSQYSTCCRLSASL